MTISLVSVVNAVVENPALDPKVGTGEGAAIFGKFISSWWGTLYIFSGIAFILYLAWGALEWIIAGGSEDRVKSAKNKIQNALVGLTIMSATFAFVKLLEKVLGIDILEVDVSKLAPK